MHGKFRSPATLKNAFQSTANCGEAPHLTASSATISITQPALTPESVTEKTENDLGHWRNRWNVPPRHEALARRQGALPLGDGTWLGYRRFATSEEAEREAQRFADYNFTMFSIRYIGPEFFPDY